MNSAADGLLTRLGAKLVFVCPDCCNIKDIGWVRSGQAGAARVNRFSTRTGTVGGAIIRSGWGQLLFKFHVVFFYSFEPLLPPALPHAPPDGGALGLLTG
jgi:hypothetical protein